MKDINITIKQPDGYELTVSADMIEEDVIRTRFGLDAKEQYKEEEGRCMMKKFKLGDRVYVNDLIGQITGIKTITQPVILRNHISYRYEVTFDSGHLVDWFDENELELYVEKSCEPSNNIIQNSATRPCYYLEEKATFHRWVDETKLILKFDGTIRIDKFKEIKQTYEEHGIIYPGMDAIPVITTFALIEVADGSMKKVPPEEIRFLTDEELFQKERNN